VPPLSRPSCSPSFSIAIVGRPNVGKSTLFNRLVGQKLALVDDTPGVTRDRRRHAAKLQDLHFDVIDTAGLEQAEKETLSGRMSAQTHRAIGEADIILFMMDARAGVTAADEYFADILRKSAKKIMLVANKAEAKAAITGLNEAWGLGLGVPCAISAEHGLGLSDLRDAIAALAPQLVDIEAEEEADITEDTMPEDDAAQDDTDAVIDTYDATKPLKIAIVGRPNAGKSTLINAMIGEERLLTGPEAGITRDSIFVDWQWRGRLIRLHDTAGLRRKARVETKLEKLSVGDALRAIRFTEVVVIVLDATIPFEKQDLQIADLVIREGRTPIIAFNKWDLIADKQQALKHLREQCSHLLPQVQGLRAVAISGMEGHGIDRLMENITLVHRIWNKRVPTARLNAWLAEVMAHHPPPAVSGRRLKIKYITQVKTRPPSFILACSRPEVMPQSYLRYLVNGLRESFDLKGVPIRLTMRKGNNPFAPKSR